MFYVYVSYDLFRLTPDLKAADKCVFCIKSEFIETALQTISISGIFSVNVRG